MTIESAEIRNLQNQADNLILQIRADLAEATRLSLLMCQQVGVGLTHDLAHRLWENHRDKVQEKHLQLKP